MPRNNNLGMNQMSKNDIALYSNISNHKILIGWSTCKEIVVRFKKLNLNYETSTFRSNILLDAARRSRSLLSRI